MFADLLDSVSTMERLKLSAELVALAGEIKAAAAMRRIVLTKRVMEIRALLLGATEEPAPQQEPEAPTVASAAAKPKEVTVWVGEQKLAQLKGLIDKMGKRAAKLGVDPVTLEVGEQRIVRVFERTDGPSTTWKAVPTTAPALSGSWKATERYLDQWQVTVRGDMPRLSGWGMVAAIDHDTGLNVVRSVPGAGEVPQAYFKAESKCEHCNQKRGRAQTFVMRSAAGLFKQIGRTCLKDFTGHGDAEAIAKLAEQLSNLWGYVESDEELEEREEGEGGFASKYASLDAYLPAVAVAVRKYGFVSKAKAEEAGTMSTADDAWSILQGRRREDWPTAEDEAMAAKVVEWAKGLTEEQLNGQEFLRNVSALAHNGLFNTRKHSGYVAAMVPAYLRAMGEQKQRAQASAASSWQGTIGKREAFSRLYAAKIIASEGAYGTTFIHRFTDPAGNVFVWYASGKKLTEGATYDVKATVKKHDDYKGVKQTILLRVDATEVQEESNAE